MRGLPPAREAAIAVEAVLERYVQDPVALDRMLNTVELSLTSALRLILNGQGASSGFDPVAGTPSRSRLSYTHRARNAEEIKEQMAQEARGRAAVALTGSVSPQQSDRVADPAALVDRMPSSPLPAPSPQPRVQSQRPNRTDMPWL